MTQRLASEATFRRMADAVLSAASADHVFMRFSDAETTTLRFANNQVSQHVAMRTPEVVVQVAFGRKVGTATTNRLDVASLRATVRRAEAIARLAPEDPEFLPPLPPQQYLDVPGFRRPTANVSPIDLTRRVRPVIDKCVEHALIASGTLSAGVGANGVAASTGLFGYEPASEAAFSLTAADRQSAGWADQVHRNINDLDIWRGTYRAAETAVRSRRPLGLAPGVYPVILAPAAVAGLISPLLWSLDARTYHAGAGPVAGRLGEPVIDERLSLETDPAHRDLLGRRFDENGLATRPVTWITGGAIRRLYYDRYAAHVHGVSPVPWPTAPVLTFDGPTATSLDELAAHTNEAILISGFGPIRVIDPQTLTLTGQTRPGTFLIENGRIAASLAPLRFAESPLSCLHGIPAATPPTETVTAESGKMLAPGLYLPEFNVVETVGAQG